MQGNQSCSSSPQQNVMYCIRLYTFPLELKALGWSPILSSFDTIFPVSPIICSVILQLAARSVFNSPSVTPSPGVLCALSLYVAPGFGCIQRGRLGATKGTKDRCGLHNDQQISRLSDPNPTSIPPYISPRLPRPAAQSLTVAWQARKLEACCYFPPQFRRSESIYSSTGR